MFFVSGYERLVADIKLMLGVHIGLYWKITWKFLSPTFLVVSNAKMVQPSCQSFYEMLLKLKELALFKRYPCCRNISLILIVIYSRSSIACILILPSYQPKKVKWKCRATAASVYFLLMIYPTYGIHSFSSALSVSKT